MAPFDIEQIPPDDGLKDRGAGRWVEVKLSILRCYINGFVNASKSAVRRHYVEGFSGPGVNRIRDTNERIWGSPLLALAAEPEFDRCVFTDLDQASVDALSARTTADRNRAIVRRANCNVDLVPLMGELLDRASPTLCVLDPEGADLTWSTVQSIAGFKTGPRKVEQLILLPVDMGFVRTLFLKKDLEPWAEQQLTSIYGNELWRLIYKRRRSGTTTPDEARTAYVRLYAEGLRQLGYATVLDRAIQEKPGGRSLYFLLFATDHGAGERIMNHCFDTVWAQKQPTLPGIKGPRRRRA